MSDFRHEIEPPESLEERVVGALRARGAIAPVQRRPIGSTIAAAAAAIVIFAAGYSVGVWQSRSETPPSEAPRFVLLLHETAVMAASGIPEPALVDEYRTWARNVRAGGRAIRGEKLKDETGQTLSGFFIVEASSLEAARAIAASSPHVRHGGRIEIREIDPR